MSMITPVHAHVKGYAATAVATAVARPARPAGAAVPVAPPVAVQPIHLMTDDQFATLLANHHAFLEACESHYLPVDRYEAPFAESLAPHQGVVVVPPSDTNAAYLTGYSLGFEGEDAEPCDEWPADRREAFSKGNLDGWDALWACDPDYAAHCTEMAARAAGTAGGVSRGLPTHDPLDAPDWDYIELVETGGDRGRVGSSRLAY